MTKTPFMIALYLRGDRLDPKIVTEHLGISPTDTRQKGKKRLGPHGEVYVDKIGVWVLQAATDSQLLSDHIDELMSKFKATRKIIENISGVEEAYIDVFLCFERTADSETHFFELTKKKITQINRLGLPM